MPWRMEVQAIMPSTDKRQKAKVTSNSVFIFVLKIRKTRFVLIICIVKFSDSHYQVGYPVFISFFINKISKIAEI